MSVAISGEHPLEHRNILLTQAAPAVDDQHQADQGFAYIDVMLHELEPLKPDALGNLGESVPRQVDESFLRRQFEKINELSTSGGPADTGQTAPLGNGI